MSTNATPTPSGASSAAPLPETLSESATRKEQATKIVRRNTFWAAGLGLIPLPLADVVAITAVQVAMLKELSSLYGVPFFEHKVKTIVGSLFSGLGSAGLTTLIVGSLFKVVPIIGQVASAVTMPVLAGAFTMATGKIFAAHYETGGTLLDFNVDKMREYFREEFEAAKETVKQMKQSQPIHAKPANT